MCAAVMAVVAGNPVTSTRKFTVPDVMAPVLSLVSVKSMVAAPLPTDSAPAIGGTSLAGKSVALNWKWVSSAGVTGLSLLQPVARTASAARRTERRFMATLLLVGLSG